jgi:hypothetical protein
VPNVADYVVYRDLSITLHTDKNACDYLYSG